MISEYIIASTLEARRRSAWGRLADTNIVGYPKHRTTHQLQHTTTPPLWHRLTMRLQQLNYWNQYGKRLSEKVQ
jgi:pyridoxine/pyridoxamine 5'-phosphate oxidase